MRWRLGIFFKKTQNFEELLEILGKEIVETDLHFRFFTALWGIAVKELRLTVRRLVVKIL